jgi:copper chaperone
MPTHSFDIEGMSCDHCVRAVRSALESLPGVESVNVRIGHVDVKLSADAGTSRDALVDAIEEEGYRVRGR